MFTITTREEFGHDEVYTVDVDADLFYQDQALIIFEKASAPAAETGPPSPHPAGSWAAPAKVPVDPRRVAAFPVNVVVAITEKKEG